jgi:CrcB protein
MQPSDFLWIGAGGAAGAVARALVIVATGHLNLPRLAATFSVNMLGSFCLGVVAAWVLRQVPTGVPVRPLVVIGFLGAFTTFSTLALELVDLARGGQVGAAAAYGGTTLGCGICMILLGQALIKG